MARLDRAVAALAMLSLGACFDLGAPFRDGGGRGGGAGGGGGGSSVVEDGRDQLEAHERCTQFLSDRFDAKREALAARAAPVTDGSVETALSDSGCLVLRQTYAGGRLVSHAVRQYTGIADTDAYQPPGPVPEKVVEPYRHRFDADGSNLATLDVDYDTKVDVRIEEQRANGTVSNRIRSTFDDETGSVRFRETLTSMGDDTVRFVREELIAGTLKVVSDVRRPRRQNQTRACYTNNPNSDSNVPCPVSDEKMREQVKKAAASFGACLEKYDPVGSDLTAFMLSEGTLKNLNVTCFEADDFVGQAVVDSNELRINVGIANGCEMAPGYAESTIVHELLHFTRGVHDFHYGDVNPSPAYDERAQTYTDTQRSCEALCYGTLVNKCTCAKCFGTNVCDPRCRSLPSCTQYDATGKATMSSAVGALCFNPQVGEVDGAKHDFFPTMNACESACQGKQCVSYSLACNKETCN